MIEITGPRNPTYTVKLEFENLTISQLKELHKALALTGAWSDEEFEELQGFLGNVWPES